VNNEEEWLPWVTAQKWIDYIGKNIESTSEFDKYKVNFESIVVICCNVIVFIQHII
jgi:hypothetical protein